MKQYKHIFDALVNDEQLQVDQELMHQSWQAVDGRGALQLIADGLPPHRIRSVPRTININGHEVPEPVRKPIEGRSYYIPQICSNQLADRFLWSDHEMWLGYLSRGLVHFTHEAAEAHAKALLSFTEVKE